VGKEKRGGGGTKRLTDLTILREYEVSQLCVCNRGGGRVKRREHHIMGYLVDRKKLVSTGGRKTEKGENTRLLKGDRSHTKGG